MILWGQKLEAENSCRLSCFRLAFVPKEHSGGDTTKSQYDEEVKELLFTVFLLLLSIRFTTNNTNTLINNQNGHDRTKQHHR